MIWRAWLGHGAVAGVLGLALLAATSLQAAGPAHPAGLAQLYRATVDRRLEVPGEDQALYARLAEQALARAGLAPQAPQYVLVMDRDADVQALLLFR